MLAAGRSLVLAVALAAAAAACGKGREETRGELLVEDTSPAPLHMVGVSPVDFRCEMVVTIESIEAALGRPLEQVTDGFTPPAGVARPCHYQSAVSEQPGDWSFDIDCRERALGDGERLMAQFATEPGARPVLVGKSGIDHHGVQLLFFDDDAPCYVRVQGPGAAERLAIGKLVADGLTRKNAPGPVSYVEVSTGTMRPGK